jgi:hypothetical protein
MVMYKIKNKKGEGKINGKSKIKKPTKVKEQRNSRKIYK